MESIPEKIDDKALSPKKRKKWLYTLGFSVILVIIIALYFVVLVYQNIDKLVTTNSDSSSGKAIITSDDPYQGAADAQIVIVEFGDFQCSYCYEAFPVVRELISKYGDSIKFIYRDFPNNDIHPDAQRAAEAGECAQAQGKFWEMHDKMFINQDDLSEAALVRYADEIGLDETSFEECLTSNQFANEVKQDFYDGLFAGVQGTPTFFINNTKFEGAATVDSFSYAIDNLLEIYGDN